MNAKPSQDIVEKLRTLLGKFSELDPMRIADAPTYNYLMDIAASEIDRLKDKLRLTLKMYGYEDEALEVAAIYRRNQDDILFRIQETGPWEGEFLVVREFQDYINSLIFALTGAADARETRSGRRLALLIILSNLENCFTKGAPYPKSENEFHALVESILVCTFPDLITKPTISKSLKSYIPDTGIPETRTLLEYKYIDNAQKVPKALDEIFADGVGYKDDKWDNLICVIYETERFASRELWKSDLDNLGNADVVVVKGVRNV